MFRQKALTEIKRCESNENDQGNGFLKCLKFDRESSEARRYRLQLGVVRVHRTLAYVYHDLFQYERVNISVVADLFYS